MPDAEEAPKQFIIDCSLTMAWCFEDEATPESRALQDRLESEDAVVPSIWPLEVANVLLVGERRGRLTQADVTQFITILQSLPINVDHAAEGVVFGQVLALARAHRLSVYDASYLELALRRNLALATFDRELRQAAQTLGVVLL
ncbi:ribonuclease VapC [Capsulimonas corticalis]|uniref:Ribonuclease VapC n=1 Tax=Capsulimonas corticalis TaxID=2219043 RepID=A0A402D2K4_9BACT|nr:type II toxin-antitoxin system VapC family toxin [Capsulimonas corticalis]BDI29917.1 ribonuclease VapC [Capsulimonas corticalis]